MMRGGMVRMFLHVFLALVVASSLRQSHAEEYHDRSTQLPHDADVPNNPDNSERKVLDETNIEMPSPPSRKAILLAGPHKAASTTLQTMAVHFSVLSPQWDWITPPELGEYTLLHDAKAFAALPHSFYNRNHPSIFKKDIGPQELKSIFRREVERQWSSGKNIITGSEEIDMATNDAIKGDALLQLVLEVFPPEVLKHLEALVVYRSPRVEHAKSVWKEIMQNEELGAEQKCNLREFFMLDHFLGSFATMDSLRLADALLQKGLKVKLLDMSGVKSEGVEYYSILGCELMEFECDATHTPIALNERPQLLERMKQRENVRSEDATVVTKSQLARIDLVLKQYDCAFQHLLDDENIEILHGDALVFNLKECSIWDKPPPSREQVVESIRDILSLDLMLT